ncbi:MAG: TolC family protein [bacterium]
MRRFFSLLAGLMALGAFFAWGEEKTAEPLPPPAKPVYTLVDCVNIALAKNPSVLSAMKKVEEAEGTRIEARAGLLPSLTMNAGALHREEDYATRNGVDSDRRQEDWNVNVRLTQNVYSGGAVRNRFAVSKLAKEARRCDYQAAVEQTMMDVRIAFYEVLLNEADIVVRKQAVELLKQELENQKARFAAGAAPRLNVLRAEVSLANEMPALIEAENNYKNSMVRLSELLAVPYSIENDDTPFQIKGDLDYSPSNVSLNDCLAKAEAMRPEMKARKLEIETQERQIAVEQSGNLPKLDLFVGYDVLNETSKASPHDTIAGYIAGAAGTWNIFDGFATAGRVKAAKARLGGAFLERDASRNRIHTEVRSAFLQLQQAEATVQSQAQNVSLAEESFKLVQADFNAGLNSQLDILQSRVDLTRSRLNELKARFTHKTALARLQRAISSEFRIMKDENPAPPVAAEPVAAEEKAVEPQVEKTTETPPNMAMDGLQQSEFGKEAPQASVVALPQSAAPSKEEPSVASETTPPVFVANPSLVTYR